MEISYVKTSEIYRFIYFITDNAILTILIMYNYNG